MKDITITLYEFDELDAKAKEKAIEWYRRASEGDSFWSEYIIDDAKEIGKLMGLRIDNVYYSGFCSQGDGACFEGTFHANDVKPGKVKEHAPEDKKLHQIAERLEKLAVDYPELYFGVKHSGMYCHSHSVSFNVENGENEVSEFLQDEVEDVARDFMNWIYRTLEQEWEYQNGDECIAENIKANEYTFTKEGKRFDEF